MDASYKAVDAIVQAPVILQEFVVHAVTEGIDALGEVTVRIESAPPGEGLQPQERTYSTHAQTEADAPRTFGGYGADTDIVVASLKAYLAAINKLLVAIGRYGPVEVPSVATINA